MEQPQLFGPAIGGLQVIAWRDADGRWRWRALVREDTPREDLWTTVARGESEDRAEAWQLATEALYDAVWGGG